MPSNPVDAKGLLTAAIEDPDPVIFFEPKRLYNGPFDGHHHRPLPSWQDHPLGDVPSGRHHTPLGKASLLSEGDDVTVLAYGTLVHVALTAIAELGIHADVLDLRTLLPLDLSAIRQSVEKTGRCVIAHEATFTSGFGAELAALVQAECFYSLEAPIERITGWDTPYPHAQEWHYFPGPKRLKAGIRRVLDGTIERVS